jgi:tetratricopeptide (TPR) repeat protein
MISVAPTGLQFVFMGRFPGRRSLRSLALGFVRLPLRGRDRTVAAYFAGALICCFTGCAGWKERLTDKGVSESREERAAQAIRDFEQQRDAAQYQAALDRWRQADAARAESQMAALVARRPELFEARLRLAEMLSARGEAAAEEHFRAVIANDESCAEAHHGFGLMLDGLGRREEALRHLQRATEIEPANEAYQATLKTLTGPISGGVRG